MPMIDLFVLGLMLSLLGAICLSKSRSKNTKIICGLICFLILIMGVYYNQKGIQMNYKCVESNRDIKNDYMDEKMPIPYEEASKYFDNVDVLENEHHKIMKKNDITEYSLCDKYYTDKFPFTPYLFYSKGDIYKFISEVIFVSVFFSLVWATVIEIKRTSNKNKKTKL